MTSKKSMQCRDKRWEKRALRQLIDGRLVAVEAVDHGIYTTYQNWHCRCVPCTEAHRIEQRRHRDERRAARVLVDGVMVATGARAHNSSTYSNWSCRCDVCVDDWLAMKTMERAIKAAKFTQ